MQREQPARPIMAAPMALPTSQLSGKVTVVRSRSATPGRRVGGGGADTDERDLDGKLDAQDRMIPAAG